MVLQNAKLKRELFTLEELNRLESVILKGEYSKLMNVLDDITPEKEIEMQRLINYLNPLQDGFVSEVRAQMEKELPDGPQTPEQEAEWEQKLQTEFKEYAAKQEKKNAKLVGEVPADELVGEDDEDDFEKKPEEGEVTENGIAHYVTEEDLENNNELGEEVKAGDLIFLPNEKEHRAEVIKQLNELGVKYQKNAKTEALDLVLAEAIENNKQ